MNTIESRKSTILRHVIAQTGRRAGKRPKKLLDTFVRAFYANVPVQDLAGRSTAELAFIALSNFDTAKTRKPGKTNIRVYNPDSGPDAKRDGWSSRNTIVEIATDDMPFLIDSASATLARIGTGISLLVHPILRVRRDRGGTMQEIVASGTGAGTGNVRAESIVTFAIARQDNEARRKQIADDLASTYSDVRAAVEDWPAMRDEVLAIIHDLKLRFAEGTTSEVAEAQDFLQWAHDNHFTFLGYREYDFTGNGKTAKVRVDAKKGLGILRDPTRPISNELRHLGSMPDDIQAFVRRADPLIVSKADIRSKVHRAVTLDTIGVKKFDGKGKVVGERLIVGLFTSTAYSASPRTIPLLRRKIDKVFARTGFAPASHDGKTLQHILETFPRDELFQICDNDLFDIALGIMHTQDHQRVAVFVRIDEMPLPRPLREIFVYSPRVEAIHLRGGLVARGGIRWSDRLEDFRTEILGLMKAQMVKNAVIVPVGSKGGFTVKRPPSSGGRDAYAAEGIACYKMFMPGLLDITDNLKGGKVVPPRDVVRLDGDDPYLVVAADKGTATFSDIANGIALDYGFWLGDAFASGGSVGYDHKKMGITARGAWESVKRHFRETGKDIQTEDFICVGVGDISGDVFGNGMMLSKHTKLIGAFNHLHIFIDPNPDPDKSFKERVRLFNLQRSSWSDYDTKAISKGGGIYDRKAKSINLSAEARARFGIAKASVTPNELIKTLLQADVELLWFGGIGTYIKASHETHADADDRSNDAVRFDADALRAKVIGEGANLGVTQRARIEYALAGGRLNTDSIDNSAGVDTSDHEVNIKILLDAVVAKKKLTYAQRNVQLAKLTDELAQLVLRDNYMQSQAITLIQAKSANLLDIEQRFVRMLERNGRLDRAVEHLPDEETWAERAKARLGLTRPEISIIMPYAKMWLYDALLASDLPDDPLLETDLLNYFPTALRTKYRKDILKHQLRREIIATVATNSMINRVGGTFAMNLMEKTGASPIDVARAYIVVRDAYDLRSIWNQIEALDAKVHADVQVKLFSDIEQLVERATLWLLRNVTSPINMSRTIAEFGSGIRELAQNIEKLIPSEVSDNIEFRVKRYTDQGVPAALARRIAYTILLISAPDIIRTDAASRKSLSEIARLYFQIGETFGLGWLRYSAEKLPADTHWQKLAAAAVIEELYAHQRNLTVRMMNGTGDRLQTWSKKNASAMEQIGQMLNELKASETVDLSMLAVASRHLSALSHGG